MDKTKGEYPNIFVYMVESIDGKASGEVLHTPASEFGKNYFFDHIYSWGSKCTLLGRTTVEMFLKMIKQVISITQVFQQKILKKKIIYLKQEKNRILLYQH